MFYSVDFCWHIVMCIAYMQHCTLCDQWGFLSIACSHDNQDTTYASAQKQNTLIHTLENSIGVRRYIRVWCTKCSDKFSHLRVPALAKSVFIFSFGKNMIANTKKNTLCRAEHFSRDFQWFYAKKSHIVYKTLCFSLKSNNTKSNSNATGHNRTNLNGFIGPSQQ